MSDYFSASGNLFGREAVITLRSYALAPVALFLILAAPAAAQPALAARQAMAETYARSQAAFPPALRARLAASQQTFLAYLQAACPAPVSNACAAQAYADRAGDLKDGLPRRDAFGRRFVTLKTYAATGDTIAVVQIANPRDAAERRWNTAAVAAMDQFSGRFRNDPGQAPPGVRNEYRFLIEATGPGFIESILSWRGGARWGVSRPLHWSLALNRELSAADLFANPPAAFDAITKLAQDQILADAKTDPTLPGRIPSRAELHAQVADLDNWNFSQDQLWLYTDPVPPDLITTLLPWNRVTPLLKKAAPLAPEKLRWLN